MRFLTNVADRLLRAQLNLSVQRIPVYPTNEYSVEVHRLLQMAANLYDATHSDPFPSVFRPVVGTDPLNPSGFAVTGFEYDTDRDSIVASLRNTSYNVPIVIGAKKGIPNFNEFVVQTTALAARKLEVTRTPTPGVYQTNQMWVLGISNFFGLEAWNSYTNALNNNLPSLSDVTMEIGIVTDLILTNNELPSALFFSNKVVFGMITNILTPNWEGFRPRGPEGGFKVPIYTNVMLFTNSAYRTLPSPHFESIDFANFDVGVGFPIPEWILSISNRVTYILHANGRILDFVHLDRLTNTVSLNELFMGSNRRSTEPTAVAGSWNTNGLGGATSRTVPTLGIIQQMRISVGDETLGPTDWIPYSFSRPANVNLEIGKFRSFLGLPPRQPYIAPTNNTDSKYQAPFSPARRVVRTINWQVNDPLVHHMPEHLRDSDTTNHVHTYYVKPFTDPVPFPTNLNALNIRYRPWRGNPEKDPSEDPNSINLGVKDAGIFNSDNWNSPTNLLSDPCRIGQVHRGTPWQTIYLKSEVASREAWLWNWSDHRSHPTNDWRTVGLLLPLLVTNDVRGLLSVNDTNEAKLQRALHGITVWSNAAPPDPSGGPPQFETHTMHSNSPQARVIAHAVQQTRANRTPSYFGRLGDVLSTPELTVASPWLNLSDPNAFVYGLTDEAYEKIPEQLLLRLRADPLLSIERRPNETRIVVEAYAGYLYELQRSSDLRNWEILETVFAEEPVFGVTDSSSSAQSFYRAVLLP